MATQHLINLGHERIGLISGRPLPTPFFPENDRLAGYLQALAASGLDADPALQVPGFFTIEGGEHAMTAQLAQRTPPTAVFAMSDEMAFGALRALRRHGLQAGRDVSIVGFDGHEMADLLDLTTVCQPAEELGQLAARSLLDLLDHPEHAPQVRCLPTQLYVRGSTALRRQGS
jgi:LacI family transcriptional regulator, repressor for deo operon, udp, cdd, tsx, nupC, and nupG